MSDRDVQNARESFSSIYSFYENLSTSSRSGSPASAPISAPAFVERTRSHQYGDILIGYRPATPPTAEQAAQAQQRLSGLMRSEEVRNRLSPTERELFMAAVNEPIDVANQHPSNPPQSNTNPPSTSGSNSHQQTTPASNQSTSNQPPSASQSSLESTSEALPSIDRETLSQLSSSAEAALIARRESRRDVTYRRLNTPRDG